MKDLYYLVDGTGSSVFSLPYPKDFLIHCLVILSYNQDTSDYRLLPCPFFVTGVKTMADRQCSHII